MEQEELGIGALDISRLSIIHPPLAAIESRLYDRIA